MNPERRKRRAENAELQASCHHMSGDSERVAWSFREGAGSTCKRNEARVGEGR